jgi:hypothetical protein
MTVTEIIKFQGKKRNCLRSSNLENVGNNIPAPYFKV